jgi:PTH1 family peptidyl-tRNA hydrolase
VVAVFGLGNPGSRYAGTRHNVGFRVVEEIAARRRLAPEPPVAEYRWWRWESSRGVAGLVAPQTYMNRSGDALIAWRERHGLEPTELLVVSDDVYLPLGAVRLRPRGSSGGHRGLESIEAALPGREYARLRVGVGAMAGGEEPEAPVESGAGVTGAELREYVLGWFTEDERESVEAAVSRAADAAECWLGEGILAAMNRFNRTVGKEATEP